MTQTETRPAPPIVNDEVIKLAADSINASWPELCRQSRAKRIATLRRLITMAVVHAPVQKWGDLSARLRQLEAAGWRVPEATVFRWTRRVTQTGLEGFLQDGRGGAGGGTIDAGLWRRFEALLNAGHSIRAAHRTVRAENEKARLPATWCCYNTARIELRRRGRAIGGLRLFRPNPN